MRERATTWSSVEVSFESGRPHGDPYLDVDVITEWHGPGGRRVDVPAFWDGGSTWRGRFRPDVAGEWRWRTTCTDTSDAGLHDRSGACTVEDDPNNPNPLVRHGAVGVPAGGRSFVHADGTPFFWLGDTAWNGVLRSSESDWDAFLSERARQGFSVIQFFSSTWRALPVDDHGLASYAVTDRVRVNPTIFHRLDSRVRAINRHGMLAYAIGVLALFEDEPAWALAEDDLARLLRYLDARWGAYHVAWSPLGDGDYGGDRAARVRRLCRAVYLPAHRNLVTVHPKGWSLFVDEFRDEPWFDFVSYQSCHDDTPERIRWHPYGPVPAAWRTAPARPIVNVEFNYDDHPSFTNRRPFTDREVRRAAWWSVLISPPAGLSYGHYHEWSWSATPELIGAAIRGQEDLRVGPWWRAIETPGVRSMTILRRFLETGPWWSVRPAPEILAAQPGQDDASRFVAVGQTGDRSWTIAYTPRGDPIALREGSLPASASARWLDPRTGSSRAADAERDGSARVAFRPPDEGADWVLDVRGAAGP